MNVVRLLMSAFLVILLVLSIAGWIWFGGQTSPNSEGARIVLALCGLMSIGSLALLWSVKRPQVN